MTNYKNNSSLKKYHTEIPNILTLIPLDAYEFKAYFVFKKTAGDEGECYKSCETICQEIGCGETKLRSIKEQLSLPRVELNGKSLITVTSRKKSDGSKDTDLIEINDIWPENMAFLGGNLKESLSPLAKGGRGPSPREDKEEPFEEEPKEKKKEEKRKDPIDEPVSLLSSFLFEKIKKRVPNASMDLTYESFLKQLLQFHTPKHLNEIIEWAFEHEFWSMTIQTPKTLFKSIETIKSQMSAVKPETQQAQEKGHPEPNREEIIYRSLDSFVKKNWSRFQAEHLTPHVEKNDLNIDDRKHLKFGKSCFKASYSDQDFIEKFNKFLKDRKIQLRFNA